MDDDKPAEGKHWDVLSSRQLLRDTWIDLSAEACRDARGNILDPYYIFRYKDWVQVVAITAEDQLVLVRQYRHGLNAVSLELPAGAMDAADADPVATGRRELAEETGYDAAEFRHVIALSPNTATHRNRCHTVLALGAYPAGPARLEAGEDITLELRPVTEVVAGLSQGLLPQAMHVSALLIALQSVGRLDLAVKGVV